MSQVQPSPTGAPPEQRPSQTPPPGGQQIPEPQRPNGQQQPECPPGRREGVVSNPDPEPQR
jgi:hypothetical protein